MTEMKKIKNTSGQIKCLLFEDKGKAKEIVLKPSETIVIPASWISVQVKNMAQMKLLSIQNYS